MLRVTLKIMPMLNPVASIDDPPILTKGKGCPVTESNSVETPMLIMAYIISRKVRPNAIYDPKVIVRLVTIFKARVNSMT